MRSNLTLRQLKYICEVARLRNVLAASKTLTISTSSILAAIEAAEAETGTRIFNRFPAKGVQITPAGARFVVAANRLLAAEIEFSRTTGDISSKIPSPLRIGCFEPFGTLLLPGLLRRLAQGPTGPEIVLKEGDQNELRNWLISGEIELAVLYDSETMSPFSPTPICHIPPHVALHVDDPLARAEAVNIADIARQPFVLLDHPETAPQLLAIFKILAEMPKISFRARSYGAALAAVAEGFGASIFNLKPLTFVDTYRNSIVRKPIADDLPASTLVVADLYGSEKPYFLQLFIDTFRDFMREIGPSGFSVTTIRNQAGLFP